MTTSELGSADLCAAMHTNIFPRTFSVGCPHDVVTSTSGSVRPILSTALKLVPRGMPLERLEILDQRRLLVLRQVGPERVTAVALPRLRRVIRESTVVSQADAIEVEL